MVKPVVARYLFAEGCRIPQDLAILGYGDVERLCWIATNHFEHCLTVEAHWRCSGGAHSSPELG